MASVLTCIKSKHSYVLEMLGCIQRDSPDCTTHRKQEARGTDQEASESQRHLEPDKDTYHHHVVRLGCDSNHRCSIRRFPGSIRCLPPIRHHRSVRSDRFPHVPRVHNSHGIERVSVTGHPTSERLSAEVEADSPPLSSHRVVMLVLEKLNIVQRPVRSSTTLGWSPYDANIAGGTLVGVGMALSGACPGTVLVQLAQGIPSAKAAALGTLLGAGVYVKTQDQLKNISQRRGDAEPTVRKLTIAEALRIPEAVLYPLFGLAIIAVLRFTGAKTGISLVPRADRRRRRGGGRRRALPVGARALPPRRPVLRAARAAGRADPPLDRRALVRRKPRHPGSRL